MPDLSRDQIRGILAYLEETTEMDRRHVNRASFHPKAILKGALDTEEERKYGNTISVVEQREFFEKLSHDMQLSGRAREQFEWATHPRNIGTTLRRAQEHSKGGEEPKKRDENKDEDKSDDKKKPKGFVRTMLGL